MTTRHLLTTLIIATAMTIGHTLVGKAAGTDGKETIDTAWVRRNYEKREVMIPMRDGVRLFTCIYQPRDKSTPHPILINRTCYGSGPYGSDLYMPLHSMAWSTYVKNGYILVFQDVRGKNRSEGRFEDLRPFIVEKHKKSQTDEASDTYDTVEWLLKNTSSNKRVGVFGISYPGFYSTMAAISGHPAIKAVSPQAPVTDWFRGDDAHHGGALFPLDMFSFQYWFEHQNVPDFWNGTLDISSMDNPTDIITRDAYTDYLEMGAVSNFTRLLGDSCRFWSDMVKHPDLDDWWEQRNVAYHMQEVKPAVMVVGGLFDAEDCYGAFLTYQAIRHQSPQTELYLVEGPWAHGFWSRGASGSLGDIWFGDEAASRYYIDNIEYPFFAYYLEGKGEKPAAKARVFHTGENQWHNHKEWPDRYYEKDYYLSADGQLTKEADEHESTLTYTSDPSRPVPFMPLPTKNRPMEYMTADQRFASTRTDVLTFTTPVLSEPLRLAGPVEAELYVTLSTTDADFVVKLIDVFPEDFTYPDTISSRIRFSPSAGHYGNLMGGYQMMVRGDVLRGKYRNSLDIDSTAFLATSRKQLHGYTFHPRKPEPFFTGVTEKVIVRLTDVAHTFLPGHRMMIQVQSSWFPLVDRNPQYFCNIYECTEQDFRPCTVTIHTGGSHPSRIHLPVAGE